MIKTRLRQCHLVVALVTGIFFVITGLTGAALIYAKPIQHLIHPQYWKVEPRSHPLSLDKINASVQDEVGKSIDFITVDGPDKTLAWQAKLQDGSYVSINPYSGSILLQYLYEETFYGFSMALHRWLLLPQGQSRDIARYWVSVVAILMLLEVLFGFYLWVRPKKPLKRLKVNFKAKRKIFFFQLHSVLGVAFFLPIVLIAFSGIAFHLKGPTAAIVNSLSPGTIEVRPTPPTVARPLENRPLQLNKAMSNAKEAFPDSTLFRIYMPAADDQPIAFRVQTSNETHAYSWVWANPYTGEVLQVYDSSQASIATQVWNFKYKFHIGMFAGYFFTPLWLLFALSPVLFSVSGIYLWWKRHNK